jgi:diguanylate cyclase (GGDEF)-like protein
VLLAEDDSVSRLFTTRLLENAGYEVTAVTNGREALDRLKAEFFPILLTDWEMPVLDGLGVVRAVRDGSWSGYIFTVLLSGLGGRDSVLAGLEAGADDYLTKPVDQAELLARIKSGWRIAELEHRLRSAEQAATRRSLTDALTSLPNRLYLDENLQSEIERARRFDRPLSVILADIDHFKSVNDTHGHAVGDRVLREFGALLKDTVRRHVDWVARYGGDEYLIILPDTHAEGGRLTAERLRDATEAMAIVADGTVIRVTASFGVVTTHPIRTERTTASSVIAAADQRLYESKRAGRNRSTADG